MELIKWLHFYVMPVLGWYFFIALLIGAFLALRIIMKKDTRSDFYDIMVAIAPLAIGWLGVALVIIWFSVASKRREREIKKQMEARHRP